jgi:hypothetical protein
MNRSRLSWVWHALPCLLTCVLCNIPVFNLLGYAFCLALTCCIALTAPCLGYLKGFQKQHTVGSLCVLACTHVAVPLLLITANALRVRNCNFLHGFLFYSVLVFPSALYGVFLGHLCSMCTRRPKLWLACLITAPLAWQGFLLYTQPPVFAYSHLWGYFAGPLYDEVITVHASVGFWRLGTALRVALMAIAVYKWRTWHPRNRFFYTLCALSVAFGYDAFAGPRTGFFVLRSHIEKILSHKIETPQCVLHLPKNMPQEQRTQVLEDHLYQAYTLTRTLGITPFKPLHSYVYHDAQQKKRWMGAAHTMLAKPWMNEIHIHHTETPNLTLPHEWVHVLTSAWARTWLGVPLRYGVFVHMPIVEGTAEAFAPAQGVESLHTQARLVLHMRKNPPMENLLNTQGFWTASSQVAYTLMGSLIRYIADTYGIEKIQTMYAQASFNIEGLPAWPQLFKQWQDFLNTWPLSLQETLWAQEKFKTPSLFMRPCAHEVARLQEALQQANSKSLEAYQLAEKICDYQGNTPSAQLNKALSWYHHGHAKAAVHTLEPLSQHKTLTLAEQARLHETLALHAWDTQNITRARTLFQWLVTHPHNPSVERLHWVRLWALEQHPEAFKPWRLFLQNTMTPWQTSLFLMQQHTLHPKDPTLHYLIGRQLHAAGLYQEAISYLSQYIHPYKPIEEERLRLLANTYERTSELKKSLAFYTYLSTYSRDAHNRSYASQAAKRLAWKLQQD